jgi:DHA1 family multidrug resistance protein-like MFS transporter
MPGALARDPDAAATDWRRIFVIYWITTVVEGAGVAQVYALLPQLLSSMGITGQDRLGFVGLFGALLFLVGMPLVPIWGVWADRYSRRAVIARSAVVEAVVFTGMALAREPWHVALSMLLIGFQLGNTGVMLGAIRDSAPRARLGTVIAVFGAAGPIGFALGPILAGALIDDARWSISAVFALSAVLSLGTAALVGFGSREIRPAVVPQGRVLDLAFGAVRGVLSDPAVRRVFLVFGTAYLANQMSRPYLPLIVESAHPASQGLSSAIGLVAGTAALAGGLLSPVAGAIGDRVGFRPVLIVALVSGGIALSLMPFIATVGGVAGLAIFAVAGAAAVSTTSSMVFSLLATEVPAERRSQTLSLVYMPLYAAGIIGPAIGGVVSSQAGLGAPFVLGGFVFVLGAVVVIRLGLGSGGRRGARADAIDRETGIVEVAESG